jgi:eukaryotic-like serine/threonine-protein kinase
MTKTYKILLSFTILAGFYACKVTEPIPKSTEKSITKFGFPLLTPFVEANIDQSSKLITATVPFAVDITKISTSISVSPKAKVSPDSGATQDFSKEVKYTVTAEDKTFENYKVVVKKLEPSFLNEILEFSFDEFNPVVIGNIDTKRRVITSEVPFNANLYKLKVKLKISPGASAIPASGDYVDFSRALTFFKVKSEGGYEGQYIVNVIKALPPITIKLGQNPNKSVVYMATGGGFSIIALDALTGKELWKFYNQGNSSSINPTIYKGNLAVVSKGVRFINANTGELAGYIPHDEYSGSSPVIVDDIMYYGSGSDGYLRAFDLKTNKQKWTAFADYWVNSSPTIYKNTAFVSIQNGNAFNAFDLETGKLRWSSERGVMQGNINACGFENLIITAGYGSLIAFDTATGSKIWSFTDRAGSSSSPTVSDGIVYVGDEDKNLYALNAKDGKLKWKFKTGASIDSSPIVDGNLVYIASKDGYLYACDKNLGTEKWKFKIGETKEYSGDYEDSSPVVAEGIVYMQGKNIYYAVNAKTGEKIWEYKDGLYQNFSSPLIIDKNGKLYHSGISGMQN